MCYNDATIQYRLLFAVKSQRVLAERLGLFVCTRGETAQKWGGCFACAERL